MSLAVLSKNGHRSKEVNRLENDLFVKLYALIEDAGRLLSVNNASIRNAIYNSSVGNERAMELLKLANYDYYIASLAK